MKYIEIFFWGVLAAFLAAFVEFLIPNAYFMLTSPGRDIDTEIVFFALPLIFLTSFIEEFFKFVIIAKRIRHIFSKNILVIASMILGLGFGLTETFFIFGKIGKGIVADWNYVSQLAVLHVFSAGIIGYFISSEGRSKLGHGIIWVSLAVATLTHFIFNYLVLNDNVFSQNVVTLYLLILFAFNILFASQHLKNLRQPNL